MKKAEKAMLIGLLVTLLLSTVMICGSEAFVCRTLPQWWGIVFPTLADVPEGSVTFRFYLAELLKNVSPR